MMTAPVCRFESEQELPISLKDAWDFFSRPENLVEITPNNLGFEIISPLPQKMYAGMIVSYRVRPLFGIPMKWTTEITHVHEPFFFVDEQRIGPYRFWHHQHMFSEIESGVRMKDLVHYQVGWGLPGHWLSGSIVRRRLREIFTYRKDALTKRFASPL